MVTATAVALGDDSQTCFLVGDVNVDLSIKTSDPQPRRTTGDGNSQLPIRDDRRKQEDLGLCGAFVLLLSSLTIFFTAVPLETLPGNGSLKQDVDSRRWFMETRTSQMSIQTHLGLKSTGPNQ